MFKAKKWMLSRAADTKAGRSAVIKLIGESGDDIIQVSEGLWTLFGRPLFSLSPSTLAS
jgi:hypothetical protein